MLVRDGTEVNIDSKPKSLLDQVTIKHTFVSNQIYDGTVGRVLPSVWIVSSFFGLPWIQSCLR